MKKLISDLSSTNLNKKRSAARELASLTANAMNHDAIQNAQGILALIGCLSDQDTDVRNNAASVLGNLAYNNATNQNAIQNAQGIPALIGCLSDEDEDVRKNAARALGNLAYNNTTNQDAIREAGGGEALKNSYMTQIPMFAHKQKRG
jgi:HEAT repeat protein